MLESIDTTQRSYRVLRLYNTLGRTIEEFTPISDDRVGLYTCGPTVYNFAHIGNLRSYLFEDILRRALEYLGFRVSHVMNVTDVGHLTDDADEGEDKMLRSAREKGMSVWDIANHYTDAFFADLELLNVRRPTIVCKATEHIPDMINMIKRIEANGFTYMAGGNVYFDVSRFPEYGKMALLDRAELKSGARIEVDPNKKNPRDFVLWFTKSKFGRQAMVWDSPWGEGYPGWHIECSAMSTRYLGEQFDIHCGGVDHIPVHHTNEIAQTEAATGKKWVNYWIHGEFLILDDGKMAKSKGKFITLQSLMDEGYEPLDYRYFNLNAHYRTQLQFTFESLAGARSARGRLMDRVADIMDAADEPTRAEVELLADSGTERLDRDFRSAADHVAAFREHLSEDLNAPRCLADLWGLVKDETVSPRDALLALVDIDRVLGIRIIREGGARLRSRKPERLEQELLDLIEKREEARKNRNFQTADQIRDMLKGRGIIVEDSADGPKWRKL